MGFDVSTEKGQLALYHIASRSQIEKDKDFLFMVKCKENPLDRETLQKLIEKYPNNYSCYKIWLSKLPSRKDIENQKGE